MDKNVLIIEDDIITSKILSSTLEKHGFFIITLDRQFLILNYLLLI
ncbi:MAG: hypothetical protein Q8936_11045 [Bacillota bacterium]|nr:hypothetical protein [Bacillota bacterium]